MLLLIDPLAEVALILKNWLRVTLAVAVALPATFKFCAGNSWVAVIEQARAIAPFAVTVTTSACAGAVQLIAGSVISAHENARENNRVRTFIRQA